MVPDDDTSRHRGVETPSASHSAPEEHDAGEPTVVVLPITDVLDLHSFPPREVRDVVVDYLEAAHERGLRELRIIHGRGIGVQRKSVQSILARHPLVVSFRDAPPDAGGWGATLVELKRGGG